MSDPNENMTDEKMAEAEDKSFPFDASALRNLINNVNPVGSFATSGVFVPTCLSPKIVVEGFGTVGLPLHPSSATGLKEKAEKAPFGRGPATLVDESVRSAWQLNPDIVTVAGPDWEETLKGVVKKAAYELGISNENADALGITGNLYKVLLYEQGDHFKPHKDTVKEEGMFATLVVQLPSLFSGGKSNIMHQGNTKQFDLPKDCDSTFQYTAFYADCEHEILPVTEGWRFCLVYNMIVTKPRLSGVVPDSMDVHTTVKQLQIEVAKWLASNTGKLGYPLDHEYTLDTFAFGSLKGRDAVVMSVLRNAIDAVGARLLDISLAIFFHQSYNGGDDSEQTYGIEKVLLEDGTTQDFERYSYGKKAITSDSPVWVEDMLYMASDGFFKEFDELTKEEQEDIDEQKEEGELDFGQEHEAWERHHDAGNEGGGSTTWYRSACLIFRPASKGSLGPTIASLCTNSVANQK